MPAAKSRGRGGARGRGAPVVGRGRGGARGGGGQRQAQTLSTLSKPKLGVNKPAGKGINKPVQKRPNAPAQLKAKPKPNPAGSSQVGRHTLLLMQATGKGTRTWTDYQNMNEALSSFVSIYEKQLKQLNPGMASLTYSAADLHQYIDELSDLSVLILDPATKQYAPHGKPFVKAQVLAYLKKQA